MEIKAGTQLRNPPLIETALSVSIVAPPMTRDAMLDFCGKNAQGFSIAHEIEDRTMVFKIDVRPCVDDKKAWSGIQFKKDGNLVLTLRNTGGSVTFMFSVLRPYTSWKDLDRSSRPMLAALLSVLGATSLSRVGIRSVNRIFAPYQNCPVTDMVRTVPPDVEGIRPPSMYEFSYQDKSYHPDFSLFSTVRRISRPVPNDPRFSAILDIDVFTPPEKTFPVGDLDALTGKIVELKDKIFFGTIGAKCLEGYL